MDLCKCKGCGACNSTLEFVSIEEFEDLDCAENQWEGALCFSCLNFFKWTQNSKIKEPFKKRVR